MEGNTPVLPPSMPRLLRALGDDDIDFAELARQLEAFPSVAGRLIAVANSAWAAPTTPVLSLLDACARLGLTVVRGLAIALAVTEPFNAHRCSEFDPERFWSSALLTADGAEMLGRSRLPPSDAPLLRTAGLLHHLGLLWLADRCPSQTAQALAVCATTPGLRLAEALRQVTETDYCKVGKRLAQVWGLPGPLVDVMGFHRDPNYQGEYRNLVGAVRDTAQLVHRLYHPPDASDDGEVSCAQPNHAEQCRAVFDMLQRRFDNTVTMARSLFSA